MIVMLEDEIDRLSRFQRVLAEYHPGQSLRHWRTARDFIAAYSVLRASPDLICLDHDLFVWEDDEPDPGDGRDVAQFLATQTPCCPVLIHSTNGPMDVPATSSW